MNLFGKIGGLNKLIIVRLQGGLGNQMFQYAACRALALELKATLYVDVTFFEVNHKSFEGFTARKYELDVFNANIRFASAEQLKSFENENLYNKLLRNIKLPFRKKFFESSEKNPEQWYSIKPPVLICGYWQSDLFFKKYTKEIQEDFKFRELHEIANSPVLIKIKGTNSVSIHIRRGDYISNPLAKDLLGVLDINYYKRAINMIQDKISNPYFFIFSDDPIWVKKYFNEVGNSMVIERNTEKKDFIDLYLMSQCSHNIIANSSFSWWAGWLNSNPEKIVIAPLLWHRNSKFTNPHLIPSEWFVV